jgi:hypothetical protein
MNGNTRPYPWSLVSLDPPQDDKSFARTGVSGAFLVMPNGLQLSVDLGNFVASQVDRLSVGWMSVTLRARLTGIGQAELEATLWRQDYPFTFQGPYNGLTPAAIPGARFVVVSSGPPDPVQPSWSQWEQTWYVSPQEGGVWPSAMRVGWGMALLTQRRYSEVFPLQRPAWATGSWWWDLWWQWYQQWYQSYYANIWIEYTRYFPVLRVASITPGVEVLVSQFIVRFWLSSDPIQRVVADRVWVQDGWSPGPAGLAVETVQVADGPTLWRWQTVQDTVTVQDHGAHTVRVRGAFRPGGQLPYRRAEGRSPYTA